MVRARYLNRFDEVAEGDNKTACLVLKSSRMPAQLTLSREVFPGSGALAKVAAICREFKRCGC
jgi:hypothetical protein